MAQSVVFPTRSHTGLASGHARREIGTPSGQSIPSRSLRIKPMNAAHPPDARPSTASSLPSTAAHSRMHQSQPASRDHWAWILEEDAVPPAENGLQRHAPRPPSLLPRDAKIKPNDLLDVALFLRDTAPSQTPTRPTFDPQQPVLGHKKSFRQVLKFERRAGPNPLDPTKNRSLTHFQPQGVVQRVSKDGKKYLQIVLHDHPVDSAAPGISSTTSANTSILNIDPSSPTVSPADRDPMESSFEDRDAPSSLPPEYKSFLNDEEIHKYISTTEEARGHDEKAALQKMWSVGEFDFANGAHNRSNQRTPAPGNPAPNNNNPQIKTKSGTSNRESQSTDSNTLNNSRGSDETLRSTDTSFAKPNQPGRLAAVRASLPNPPTISGPAPSRPLPTLPADGADQRLRMRGLGSKPIDSTPDVQPGFPAMQRHGSDRSSNQGRRRALLETNRKPPQSLANPTHRIPSAKRSLNALKDFLARDALDSAHVKEDPWEPQDFSSTKNVDYDLQSETTKAPSISTTTSGQTSSHRQRQERTRARKLRDLEKAKNIDSIVEMPVISTDTSANGSERAKPDQSAAKPGVKGLQLSAIMVVAEQNPIPSPELAIAPEKPTHLVLAPSPLPPDGGVKQPESVTKPGALEQPRDNIVLPMKAEKDVHPAYRHGYHSSTDSQDLDHVPQTSFSTPSRTATYFTLSGDPSEGPISPNTRLELRVRTLERRNRLLEAALNAVLHTNGQLNRCPCSAHGQPSRTSMERPSTNSSASAGDYGSAYELYKATRGVKQPRASLDSPEPQEVLAEELEA